MKKVIHIRDQYLRVSFIYFLLTGFKKYVHIVACREIFKSDLVIYPYTHIKKTAAWLYPFFVLDKIVTIKFKAKARIINDWWSYFLLIRNEKDILAIHAHMGGQGYYAIPLIKIIKKPLFVTFYGGDMSHLPLIKGWRDRFIKLFEIATCIIVEGPYMRSKIIELGCPPDKVTVVKIGVPLNHLTFQYRKPLLANDTLNILMCANFFPKKGYLKALQAIKSMKEQGQKLNVEIIGEGPLRDKIENFIQENNLNDIVTLHGKKTLSEIYEISKEMHVFFHPSETAPDGGSEGGAPTIIIEMQALGLPIIATTHADIPNIIPVQNHFLAEEYDWQGLVTQFENLKSIKNWDSISELGREFVMKEHENEKCSGEIELLYEKFSSV